MPYVPPTPIDFNANRRALVQAVALATGLPAGQVIALEPETMGAPRPKVPYVGFLVTAASVKMGFDWLAPMPDDAVSGPTGRHTFSGVRMMSVGFDAYGRSHEDAYGIMAAFQAALEYPPVASLLAAAGLAVWDIGSVSDISATLATTYEGRAHLDVTFGMTAQTTIDLGRIDTVPVSGQVASDGNATLNVPTFNVTR